MSRALEALAVEKQLLEQELKKVNQAISVLGGSRTKKRMSAATRQKLSDAQKARWAKVKKKG